MKKYVQQTLSNPVVVKHQGKREAEVSSWIVRVAAALIKIPMSTDMSACEKWAKKGIARKSSDAR